MREVGRSLALDPGNADALSAMVRLLTDPPRKPPPEVKARIVAARERSIGDARRYGAVAMACTFLPVGLCVWMGLRDPAPLLVSLLATVAGAVLTLLPTRLWRVRRALVSALGVLGIVAASRLAHAVADAQPHPVAGGVQPCRYPFIGGSAS